MLSDKRLLIIYHYNHHQRQDVGPEFRSVIPVDKLISSTKGSKFNYKDIYI
jgi:hypothetical protein